MSRKVRDGNSARVTVPQNSNIPAGNFALVQGWFGMAVQEAITGAGVTKDIVLNTEQSLFETSQITVANAFAKGDLVYWDDATKLLTTVRGGAPVGASLATGVVGTNNAIRWTARDPGAAGNGISVRLVNPGAASQALSVVVAGNDIVINLATDAASALTSTATLVMAAIAASAAANAFVTVANEGASTGAGVVAAVATTNLAGGSDVAGDGRLVGRVYAAKDANNVIELLLRPQA
ncbi:MAG TPA: capsid cement protein [Chloroflexota bacterium]|nr:capsid cement protein [Chloroflexota bacterium]